MKNYFSEKETKCRCGCGFDITPAFKKVLNRAREISDTPYNLTSGARCLKHNRTIGSNDTSTHTKGEAVDISFKNSNELYKIVTGLVTVGFNRIGINFAKSFIHVDADKDKAQCVIFSY